MRNLIPIVFLTLSAPATGQIYKCTIDGQTTYSQKPCADSAEEMDVNTRPPTAGADGPGLRPQEILEDAVARKRVRVGMSADQVTRSWGRPTTINRTLGTYGVTEQWVYRRGAGSAQYVYFDNGTVSSIQE